MSFVLIRAKQYPYIARGVSAEIAKNHICLLLQNLTYALCEDEEEVGIFDEFRACFWKQYLHIAKKASAEIAENHICLLLQNFTYALCEDEEAVGIF